MPSDNKFDLEGFSVDKDNVCTAEGGFVGVFGGQTTNYHGNGAISIDDVFATVGALGSQTNLTLGAGMNGQSIKIVCIDASFNTVITPDVFFNGTTITFDAVNEYVELIAVTTGWRVFSSTATIA